MNCTMKRGSTNIKFRNRSFSCVISGHNGRADKNLSFSPSSVVALFLRMLMNKLASIHRLLDVHESVHRDTTMKITNKIHYIN